MRHVQLLGAARAHDAERVTPVAVTFSDARRGPRVRRVLSADEIEQVLRIGYELRGFEVKGPGDRGDNHFTARVIRAALGLGNLRDGGHIVIGIDDDDPASLAPGLSADQLVSWLAYDDVARKFGEYADPPINFAIEQRTLSVGVTVAVIHVHEFDDIPHICAKQFDPVLRKGAVYGRPRKVPETSEVGSSIEMRDLIELATEKALRRYVETAERAGIALALTDQQASAPDDAEQFDSQRREAWE